MIHINHGDDPHEWLTRKEFEEKYPDVVGLLKDHNLQLSEKTKLLKYRRQKKRITLREFSKKSGLSFEQISRLENGSELFTPDTRNKYIFGLNKS